MDGVQRRSAKRKRGDRDEPNRWYAVAIGLCPGIYDSWAACKAQTHGYSNAVYKSFGNLQDATFWISVQPEARDAAHNIVRSKRISTHLSVLERTEQQWLDIDSNWSCVSSADDEICAEDFWTDDAVWGSDVASNATPASTSTTVAHRSARSKPLPSFEVRIGTNTTQVSPADTRVETGRFDIASSRHTPLLPESFRPGDQVIWRRGQVTHLLRDRSLISSADSLHVYTDGSASANGSVDCCAGYGVYFGSNHPLNLGRPLPPAEDGVTLPSSNRAELIAILHALIIVHPSQKLLVLHVDSEYAIKCSTRWGPQWVRNGTLMEHAHHDLIGKILLELERRKSSDPPGQVKFKKERAHSGVFGNEEADKLAKQGSGVFSGCRNDLL